MEIARHRRWVALAAAIGLASATAAAADREGESPGGDRPGAFHLFAPEPAATARAPGRRVGGWSEIRLPALGRALLASLAREAVVRELVGRGELRRLREARFEAALYRDWPGRRLADDPERRERVQDALEEVSLDLCKELLERTAPLVRLRSRLEEAGPGDGVDHGPTRRSWIEISPQAGVGHRRYLGAEIELGGLAPPFLRRTGLELRHGLDTGEHLLRLSVPGPRFELVVDQRLAPDRVGDSLSFSFRWEL